MPDRKSNGRHWPLEQSTVRTWSLLAIVPTLLVAGYVIGTELSEINSKLNAALKDRFDRADMAEWCREAERENPGFNCTNPYGLPSLRRRFGALRRHDPLPLLTRP